MPSAKMHMSHWIQWTLIFSDILFEFIVTQVSPLSNSEQLILIQKHWLHGSGHYRAGWTRDRRSRGSCLCVCKRITPLNQLISAVLQPFPCTIKWLHSENMKHMGLFNWPISLASAFSLFLNPKENTRTRALPNQGRQAWRTRSLPRLR